MSVAEFVMPSGGAARCLAELPAAFSSPGFSSFSDSASV
jgi:hypothetical protein